MLSVKKNGNGFFITYTRIFSNFQYCVWMLFNHWTNMVIIKCLEEDVRIPTLLPEYNLFVVYHFNLINCATPHSVSRLRYKWKLPLFTFSTSIAPFLNFARFMLYQIIGSPAISYLTELIYFNPCLHVNNLLHRISAVYFCSWRIIC